jgi:hypothetical protein
MKKIMKRMANEPTINMYQERISIIFRAHRLAKKVPTPKVIRAEEKINIMSAIGHMLGMGTCGLGGASFGITNMTSDIKAYRSPNMISKIPKTIRPALPGFSELLAISHPLDRYSNSIPDKYVTKDNLNVQPRSPRGTFPIPPGC